MNRQISRHSILLSSVFKMPSAAEILSFSSTNAKRLTAKALIESLDSNPNITFDDFWEKISLLNEEQYQLFIILVFKKDPCFRTNLEISFLEKITQNYTFFQEIRGKISHEAYCEFFKELRYESHRAGTVLFNYGEVGKKFYLILSGSVYVLVPKPKNKVLIDQTFTKFRSDSKQLIAKEFKNPTLEDKLMENYPNMHIINTLREGRLFGEISLSLKEPRTATIICKEDCCFGVLSAHNYDRILKNNYELELKFLKRTAIFQSFSMQNLAILKGYFHEEVFSKDAVIYKQNEIADRIYIVKEGEIDLLRHFEINLNDSDISINKKNLSHQKNNKRVCSLGKLGSGESFGEEEIFNDKPRLFTAKVSSLKGRVMYINRENLFQNLKSLKNLNSIEEQFTLKFKWRIRQINSMKITLEKTNEKEETKKSKPLQLQNFLTDPCEENKTIFLQTLSLKHIKKNLMKINEEDDYSKPYSLYFQPKGGSKTQRTYEPEEKEKTLKNYEISKILKIAAISTALSTLAKSKRKFSLPNVKQMAINYENETKKAIENSVQKKVINFDHKKKEYHNYLEDFKNKNKEDKDFLAKRIGIKGDYFLKSRWRNEKIGKERIFKSVESAQVQNKHLDKFYIKENNTLSIYKK